MVCTPVRSIIPSLKLGDYLSVQVHKPCSISHLYSFIFQHQWNMYGAQPTYMNVEDDGKANMVFLKNSNAMGKLYEGRNHSVYVLVSVWPCYFIQSRF